MGLGAALIFILFPFMLSIIILVVGPDLGFGRWEQVVLPRILHQKLDLIATHICEIN